MKRYENKMKIYEKYEKKNGNYILKMINNKKLLMNKFY